MHGSLAITSVTLPSADAEALMAQLDAELEQRYPEFEHSHLKRMSRRLGQACAVVLIANAGSSPVGCCALRRLGYATGEIRRMFVLPSARGAGIGAHLLVEVERYARHDGLRRLVLTTGMRQSEAIRLYETHGFTRVQCPSERARSHISICMTKMLTGN